MAQVQLAHTADLDGGTLRAVRNLLERVFEGEFDDHDWEHSLGGMHVLLRDGTELVGHASLIQRRLLHRPVGRAHPVRGRRHAGRGRRRLRAAGRRAARPDR